MTGHDQWQARLSLYLDRELDASAQNEVETHLTGCTACRATLEELRRVVAWAPGYRGADPSRDLWPGIGLEIEHRREIQFPRPVVPPARWFRPRQLLAASLAMTAVGLGAWFALRDTERAPAVATAGQPAAPVIPAGAMAEAAYEAAVADLEQVLMDGRSRLDTSTVRVIEESLGTIDRAIAEARAAIAADPANAYLRGRIAATQRQKLDLLRRAAAAVS
jgi:anti-sigma factor RsiW